MDAGQSHRQLIEELARLNESEKITGYIASDPLAIAASDKMNDRSIEEIYGELNETANAAAEHMPSLKTIMVNTAVYHNGGANAVQELAFALAAGVNHLQYFLGKCKNLKKFYPKCYSNFLLAQTFLWRLPSFVRQRFYGAKLQKHMELKVTVKNGHFSRNILIY